MVNATSTPSRVPVMRPELPRSSALLPYLQQMDDTQIYSNFGPMTQLFETKMAQQFKMEAGGVTATASGTMAIIGAILATAGRADKVRTTALCASYTFVATASAIESCGYTPYFTDIDPNTWSLDPIALRNHAMIDTVGLVVVTAPYGRQIDLTAWEAFVSETGIPVVIDAAACFDVLNKKNQIFSKTVPVAMSFHATKAFGCGEGGGIFSACDAFTQRAHRAVNNGFWQTRCVIGDNINGKMSEYHACVALAELDSWDQKIARLNILTKAYQQQAAQVGLGNQVFTHDTISAAYTLCFFESPEDAAIARMKLSNQGFDTRFWYGFGLHAAKGFGPFLQDTMEVTNHVSRCLLGVPMLLDLSPQQIQSICFIMARCTSVSKGVSYGRYAL